MKTIVEPKEKVAKILGTQRLHTEATYRLMRYVIQTECDKGVLLHNVITGQLVLLGTDEAAALVALPASMDQLAPTDMSELVAAYYLVPMDYDERSIVDKLRMLMRHLFTPKGINSYTILTTTNCNAHCFYCYQAGYKHVDLSEEMAHDLVEYMMAHKTEGPVRLHWFGGEPLVGTARIEQICGELKRRGVEYESSMISNGYLFTEELAKKAVCEWHLKRIQITLDGTEDVYNSVKRFQTHADESPYQRVLRNIAALQNNGVRVSIRLNLDQHNAENLGTLIDELAERFKDCDKLHVYVYPLFDGEGFAPIQHDDQQLIELRKLCYDLNRRISLCGIASESTKLVSLKSNCCMADNPGSVVIYPDGRFFRCEHTAPGDEYGSLSQGVTNQKNYDKYREYVVHDECEQCVLYPSCIHSAGCYGSGNLDSNHCKTKLEKAVRRIKVVATT